MAISSTIARARTQIGLGAVSVAALTLLAASCTTGSTRDEPVSPSPVGEPSPGEPTASPTAGPRPTGDTSPIAGGGPTAPFDADDVRLGLEAVAGSLDSPVLIVSAGDGTDRLFIVEQVGRIRVVEEGELAGTPYLDLRDRLVFGGEQGLLGLAFHPSFEENGRFFVDYTDLRGDTVVSEFRVPRPDASRADAGSERVLLRVDQPFANHNGGHLAFGSDGYLYVGLGDGGSAGDPMGNGQRLDTLLGKILRIDVDGGREGAEYGIPGDNPFVGRDGARPEIWAYGLRNPWRFSFDRETGALWIGDVGQASIEEVDRGQAGRGGLNYGWNTMEGSACFQPPSGCDERDLVLPVAEYRHDDGCAITGGFVYRGSRWPALRGAYLFADYCSGTIWALDADRPLGESPVVVLETGLSISSFGEDGAGELYVADHGKGRVFLIVAPEA
jgi:glucose/arabinose dehydrogenase